VKKIIEGKAYNTETATLLVTVPLAGYKIMSTSSDGTARIYDPTTKLPKAGQSKLYHTVGGAYFLVREDFEGARAEVESVGPTRRGGRSLAIMEAGVYPLSRKEVAHWAEAHDLDTEVIERILGGVEEAGTTTGTMLLRIPGSLKKAMQAAAAESQQSVNAWLLRLVEKTLDRNREKTK
jgi:hypothetical protein